MVAAFACAAAPAAVARARAIARGRAHPPKVVLEVVAVHQGLVARGQQLGCVLGAAQEAIAHQSAHHLRERERHEGGGMRRRSIK